MNHPMRQAKREVKDRGEIDQMIMKASVCRLGLVDEGVAYIVPMNFGYDGECLYFHSAREGRKVDALRRYARVCFEMEVDHGLILGDKACDCSNDFESVMGEGTAELIEDEETKRAAMDIIMSHYSEPPFQYVERGMRLALIIKVRIAEVRGKRHLKRV